MQSKFKQNIYPCHHHHLWVVALRTVKLGQSILNSHVKLHLGGETGHISVDIKKVIPSSPIALKSINYKNFSWIVKTDFFRTFYEFFYINICLGFRKSCIFALDTSVFFIRRCKSSLSINLIKILRWRKDFGCNWFKNRPIIVSRILGKDRKKDLHCNNES